jgi:5-methylcytosine-specific restriction enzyme A
LKVTEAELKQICRTIRESVGAEVSTELDESSKRRGIRTWFKPFRKSEGPQFLIKPSGLRRHQVSFQFGNYARPCIEQVQKYAQNEHYSYSRTILKGLADKYEVTLSNENHLNDWVINQDFSIKACRADVKDQYDTSEIQTTVEELMVPMIACIAELIGLELDHDCSEGHHSEYEGRVINAMGTKRERSPRNRLLCLAFHEKVCFICGFDPTMAYGEAVGNILEVHHIEPLSQLKAPRLYDPKTDLIPLCPNCHRAVHARRPAYLPEEIKELLKGNG